MTIAIINGNIYNSESKEHSIYPFESHTSYDYKNQQLMMLFKGKEKKILIVYSNMINYYKNTKTPKEYKNIIEYMFVRTYFINKERT